MESETQTLEDDTLAPITLPGAVRELRWSLPYGLLERPAFWD